MEKSVRRTGTIRLLPQTKRVSGASMGAISSVPELASESTRSSCGAGGIDQRLQHRELRLDAALHRRAILIGEFQLVGGVDLGVELDGLDRRSLEAQRLRPLPGLRARGLDLQGAGDGVRVVLERDDALHLARVGIDQHQAAFEDLR